MIKKLLRTSKLITLTITSSGVKMIRQKHRKKIIQVTNGSKRFTTFPTMINLGNISLITEIKFLRTLINSFAF